MDSETHRRVVRWIAANRFPFPGQTNWPNDYITLTNEASHTRSIITADGEAYPEIVIIDRSGAVREGGVVETEVTDDMGARWASYSRAFDNNTATGVRHFFVYVPEGLEERAQALLEAHAVSFAGLRAYTVDGDDVRVTPILTPGDSQDHR